MMPLPTLKNVEDVVRIFPNFSTQIKMLHPSDFKGKEIGHVKFFSHKNISTSGPKPFSFLYSLWKASVLVPCETTVRLLFLVVQKALMT